ncbi:MAG: type II toxin-antitoxin system HicA family toxin [Rhodoplanes sp.]
MEKNSRKLIRMQEKDGWVLERVTGDHHTFKHPQRPTDHGHASASRFANRTRAANLQAGGMAILVAMAGHGSLAFETG